ncbi:HoxN/HupN/NixA family nickel/cobalt transporter [Commensalibacter papalotli (ex Botero et al. 2024)]|uniref:Nickel/cobalt efflux system n=1 Tax=Commensalibacter papalotli (ex Botero et al. 2024) TaxID=2972766 RepID=A0ABN8WE10_9PROT|nr:HoxN/HupN/NixA family nickel/cobalt transporter [Commensalibacter papalotli (ex Botero et al. 2024)]CAI3953464.1 High-affinity nickel/cobalt permease (HoxN) [Commensalibacter papalotli (ex Botero et al. 2024)]CAI3953973.1 High-affinity nickel/cobalt permease (HoxN) [Commensalibacter papalotli (ex Botero et al. 2024)]
MFTALKHLFDESSPNLKARIITIYIILAVINIGAWIWAFIAFYDKPTLLGVSLVIYGLGLRHAVDADHIAAIDNVTRKLMQMNQRPVSVGFFFAMGHSTVVFIAAALVAIAASTLNNFGNFQKISGVIGTLVSSAFLLIIAIMNICIFVSIYKSYKRVKAGGSYIDEDLDLLLNNRGFLSRLFRPMFKLVTKGWHMFPLGILFGLSFDTATEVSMFGVAAAQATQGVPIESILVFPVLFAAGMSLIDTSDGILMLKAYDWAFVKPMRKLFYNMSITLVSIIVALFIGGIEALGLIADQLELTGTFWDWISALGSNFNDLGYAIIGLFIIAWLISYLIYKQQNIE